MLTHTESPSKEQEPYANVKEENIHQYQQHSYAKPELLPPLQQHQENPYLVSATQASNATLDHLDNQLYIYDGPVAASEDAGFPTDSLYAPVQHPLALAAIDPHAVASGILDQHLDSQAYQQNESATQSLLVYPHQQDQFKNDDFSYVYYQNQQPPRLAHNYLDGMQHQHHLGAHSYSTQHAVDSSLGPIRSNQMRSGAYSTEKKKRNQVKSACVNCRKACKKCSHHRPCDRCVKLDIASTCIDVPRKERKGSSHNNGGSRRDPYPPNSRNNDTFDDGENPSGNSNPYDRSGQLGNGQFYVASSENPYLNNYQCSDADREPSSEKSEDSTDLPDKTTSSPVQASNQKAINVENNCSTLETNVLPAPQIHMNDIPRAPLSFITCDSSFPNAGLRQHARRASASYVERSRLPPMRRFCEPNTTTTHQPIDSTATPFAHHSRRSSVEVLPTCTKNQPSVFSSLHTNNITPPSSSRGHSRNNSLDLPNSTLMSLPPNTMVHHTFISSSNLAPFHHSMAVLRKRYIIGNSGGVEQSSCLATDECKSCDESVAGIGSFNMAGLHLVQRATTPTSP